MVPVSLRDWGTVLSYLSANCPPSLFRALVAEVSPVTVDEFTIAHPGQPVRIGCQSEATARWLADSFKTQFEKAIRECTGCAYPVQFVPRDDDQTLPVPPNSASAGSSRPSPVSGSSPSDRRAPIGSSGNGGGNGYRHHAAPSTTSHYRNGNAGGHRPSGSGEGVADPLDAVVPASEVGEFEQYRRSPRPVTDRYAAGSPSASGSGAYAPVSGGSGTAAGMARSSPYSPAPLLADDGAPLPRTYTETHSLPLNPANTFDEFVVGPSNRLPHAAAISVTEHPGIAYNPLFIHGAVGLGKTHLLQAIAHGLRRIHPHAKLLYISCETFVSQYIRAVQTHEMERFQAQFRELDCLLIDDIHFLASKEGSQEEFFHTFNALTGANKQIVISSDSPPADIPHLQDRLVSRFKCGLQAKIDPPVFETRAAIFRQKAARHRLELSDEVVHFLAENFTHNVREMEGAVKLLGAAAAGRPGNIELGDARRYLRDLLEEAQASAPAPKTIEEIVTVVADFYGTRVSELQSKNRQRHVVLPRQISMYLVKTHTNKTLEEIGGYFGGRDHSTVLHSIEKVRKMAEDSADFRGTLSQLDRKISA